MLRSLILLWLAAPLLWGCATPYETPVFAANDGADSTFQGVADLLDRQRPLDVLIVHGMCTQKPSWPNVAAQNLYQSLGGVGAVNLAPAVVDGTRITLYQQTLELARGRIHLNAVFWSPVTQPLKAQLCYDQTDKSATCPAAEAAKTYPYRRVTLNRTLKDGILDDCLSDAMIYQGKSRDQISAQMRKAILQAVATSGGVTNSGDHAAMAAAIPKSLPLVMITESLGSKIAFDALLKLVQSPATATAGQRTFDRTAQIFMQANQLPILALADQNLDGTDDAALVPGPGRGYPADPLAALLHAQRPAMRDAPAVKPPQVVAFTDPNDLLTYALVQSPHAAAAGYRVVDAIVSNATSVAGLVELPTTAHTGYSANPAVQKLIACGHQAHSACGQ